MYGEDDNFRIDLKDELLFVLGSAELEPKELCSVIIGGAEVLESRF